MVVVLNRHVDNVTSIVVPSTTNIHLVIYILLDALHLYRIEHHKFVIAMKLETPAPSCDDTKLAITCNFVWFNILEICHLVQKIVIQSFSWFLISVL